MSMKQANLLKYTIIVLLLFSVVSCKRGEKGERGSTGPLGSSLFSDKVQRSGFITSDLIFVSIPGIRMEAAFITVNVTDTTGLWTEIPFFSATILNNVAYTADSTGITIYNAFSSGLTKYTILIVQ